MTGLRESLGIKSYLEGSGTWIYSIGGHYIGWYMTYGLSSFLEYDAEKFQWRSEYEAWLIKMLAREFERSLFCLDIRTGEGIALPISLAQGDLTEEME